jgi:hypothetical protein
MMLRIPLQQAWWSSRPVIVGRRFGPLAGFPDRHRALDPRHVTQFQFGQLGAEAGVGSVSGIGQHDSFGNASRARQANLFQRDFGLGPEQHLGGHPRFLSPLAVVGPYFRQIQTERNRHAGGFRRHRKAHGHPAVVLLADLTAVLARHPY